MVDKVAVTQAEDEQTESYDTSDPVSVNKARKKSARTRADRLRFVEAAMKHEEGRAWFYDIMVRCHIFQNPFVSGDQHATSFKCGEQNIGRMIMDDVQTVATSEQYLSMINENKVKNG